MLMFSSTNDSLLVGSPTLYPVSKSSPVVESSHFLDNKIPTPKRKLNKYLKIYAKLNVTILKEKNIGIKIIQNHDIYGQF